MITLLLVALLVASSFTACLESRKLVETLPATRAGELTAAVLGCGCAGLTVLTAVAVRSIC